MYIEMCHFKSPVGCLGLFHIRKLFLYTTQQNDYSLIFKWKQVFCGSAQIQVI